MLSDVEAMANRAESGSFVGRWLRMSASDQRIVFGANMFGRKAILIDSHAPGRVIVRWTTSFGQDFERLEFSFAEIAAAVAEGRGLSF